ncbi:hypothetical protein OG21DRAFT_269881 [Imleria badia]|nr:hypothetical protein OG21DRAFT_269881 [Imleria badia]
MSSPILSDSFKKFRGRWQKTPAHRAVRNPSIATAILAASRPILAFSSSQIPCSPTGSPPESTIYRDTSDAAQAFLPPVQAVADVIPGVGGIIKGAIGGILTTLQLVDVIQTPFRVLLLILNLHHRDTSRTRKIWKSSPSDCTCFGTI